MQPVKCTVLELSPDGEAGRETVKRKKKKKKEERKSTKEHWAWERDRQRYQGEGRKGGK